MFYELNDNDFDMNLDYFNIDKKTNTNTLYNYDNFGELDLENGYYLGNIFVNTYKPYKNYKQNKLYGYSEQQKLLLKISKLDFILNDLNLYLDINPNDDKMFKIFKKTAIELDNLKKEYYDKYQVLELCKDLKNKYTWLDNPWPWDGDIDSLKGKRITDFIEGGYYV